MSKLSEKIMHILVKDSDDERHRELGECCEEYRAEAESRGMTPPEAVRQWNVAFGQAVVRLGDYSSRSNSVH